MNKLLATIAVLGLVLVGRVSFAEEKKAEPIKGVLIDIKCGKGKVEEAVAKHPKACAIRCEASGYCVVSGKKVLTFDEKGNELAKKYLAVEENGTAVLIEGTVKDDTIAVTSIKAQKKE